MKHKYKISGMTCENCASKVRSALLLIPEITAVDVDKPTDTAIIEMESHVSIDHLQQALNNINGNYRILPLDHNESAEQAKSWFKSYKPILIVFFYITFVTLMIQYASGSFNLTEWMRHFMSGFFIVFSFFKILDLSGFADSYMTYDIIASRWRNWAFIYAFVELGLGAAYLINCCPLTTNIIAFIVMSLSIIGVLKSVLNNRKIQCACLGAVFDLPMSTVTIIEDALMILMSGYMILNLIL